MEEPVDLCDVRVLQVALELQLTDKLGQEILLQHSFLLYDFKRNN